MPRRFLRAASRAVEREKATKTYQNRSGDAERLTMATLVDQGQRFTVTLEMGAEYSNLLIKGGFSNFNEHANATIGDLNFIVGAMGARLSRL